MKYFTSISFGSVCAIIFYETLSLTERMERMGKVNVLNFVKVQFLNISASVNNWNKTYFDPVRDENSLCRRDLCSWVYFLVKFVNEKFSNNKSNRVLDSEVCKFQKL